MINNAKLCTVFAMLLAAISLTAMEEAGKKHVVVDLMDFLVETNWIQAAHELGSTQLLGAWIGSWFGHGCSPQELVPQFFNLIHTLCPDTEVEKLLWQGKAAPPLLVHHLLGTCTSQSIIEQIERHLTTHHGNQTALMKRCANVIFNPSCNSRVMQIIPKAIELIEKLQQQGHTVHILANWNHESFEQLKKRLHDLNKLNGHIIISSHVGALKGKAMIEAFLEKLCQKPDSIYFIEPNQSLFAELSNQFPQCTWIPFTNNYDQLYQQCTAHNLFPPN